MILWDSFQAGLAKKSKLGYIALVILALFSCDSADDLGVQYSLDTGANVEFFEFILESANVYVDSLRTDGEDELLAGSYTDDIAGSIVSEGYFTVSYETGPLPRAEEYLTDTLLDGDTETSELFITTEDTLKLDSIIIALETSGSVPLTGLVQELEIGVLPDELISSAVYLSGLKQENATTIGTLSKEFGAENDSIFRTRLSDEFATTFFENLSEIGRDSSRSIFSETFQSLGLFSTANSSGINLFELASDTSRMLVYTSPVAAERADTVYVTSFDFTAQNYTYLDRSNSIVGNTEDGSEIILSEEINMIDPLFGINTRFSIAPIEDFFFDLEDQENSTIIINDATFSFDFNEDAQRDTLESFYSFFYEDNGFNGSGLVINPFENVIMSDNAFLQGTSSAAFSLVNADSTAIELNAILFFQQLYNEFRENEEEVEEELRTISIDEFISLSANDVTLQRTVIPKEGIKLRIFYTTVN